MGEPGGPLTIRTQKNDLWIYLIPELKLFSLMLFSLSDHKQCLAGLQVLSGWLMCWASLSEDQLEDLRSLSSNISEKKMYSFHAAVFWGPEIFFFLFFSHPIFFFPRSTKLPSKGHLVVLTSTFLIILFFEKSSFLECFKSVLDKNIQLSEKYGNFSPCGKAGLWPPSHLLWPQRDANVGGSKAMALLKIKPGTSGN